MPKPCKPARKCPLFISMPSAALLHILPDRLKEVLGVYKLDFGVPEAIWVIRVEDFPVVVTMDAHGNSLHDSVREISQKKLELLMS